MFSITGFSPGVSDLQTEPTLEAGSKGDLNYRLRRGLELVPNLGSLLKDGSDTCPT